MTIKNETAFTKECMEGAMRASNFDNSRYKTFKLIYNMFGLIFGMMMIRELVLKMTGNEQADTFMIVLFGLVAVVFLYIGMIGMDKSNKKKFHNIYGKMVGIKFTYEIDAENIIITDEENDSDTFSWNEVVKWNQDPDNIYLFVNLLLAVSCHISHTNYSISKLPQIICTSLGKPFLAYNQAVIIPNKQIYIIRRRKAMNNQEMMELSTVDKSDFEELVKECTASGIIDQNLYTEYDVKRGLRDSNGNGVLTGLTEISDVLGNQSVHGRKIPVDGELYFQGYNVEELIKRSSLDRFRFEEATYLLLFGVLPDKDQLDRFIRILTDLQELSGAFIRDVIMKATSTNLMNSLMKSILSLYSYDEKPDDISIPNVLRQSLQLIAKMPLLSVYAYQSYRHFKLDGTLMIKNPKKGYSTAENILYMLRDDGDFTELEAKVLDICLVLHAEHGGGNNSTFTTHVVTSSGTDTYSAIASSIGS